MAFYQTLSDDFINNMFEGTNFGDEVNSSVMAKRKQIVKTLQSQTDGYWSGHTAYHMVVNAGLLKDAKFNEKKHLTLVGKAFMQNPYGIEE